MYRYDYTTRVHSISMQFLETSDCTDQSRKDETCLQFKMKKHFIKTRKISQITYKYLHYACMKVQKIRSESEDSNNFQQPYLKT